MIETIEKPISTSTTAGRAAARNWAGNLRALRITQPALVDGVQSIPADVEWVLGRDGSLTALDAEGRWWNGCSLPSRSAEYMLRKAELDGNVLCFLYPTHAAQLRHALDRMTPAQALLSLTPEWTTLRLIVTCEDFSADIAAHRLYFAAGEQWETQLDQLLAEFSGLPTPTQFIRPIMADSEPADALIAPAQKIFADHSNRRAQSVRVLRENWTSVDIARICLVAPAGFRLWDNAGEALALAMGDVPENISVLRFNSDDPASASSAALAQAAAQCDAIVMPNLGRADLPDLMPDEMPWATWLTSPRIPSAEKARPRDTLLVADASWKALAVDAGWNPDRIFVASWPVRKGQHHPDESRLPGVFRIEPKPALAIIFDTQPLEPPKRVIEYSSHRLLWESIREELLNDPFSLGESADVYLAGQMRKARIEEDGFDRPAFLDDVILHAWQQGLARILFRERLPVKLFGSGWEKLEEFRQCAAGPVRSHEDFDVALGSVVALVHAWPKPGAHPIDAVGKPVVRAGRRRDVFVRDAKLALSGRPGDPRHSPNLLTSRVIFQALNVP